MYLHAPKMVLYFLYRKYLYKDGACIMNGFLNEEVDRMIKKSNDPSKSDEVRFSLTFNKFDNRRIEYIRRKLKLSKQELLHNLIIAAVADIEFKLGLMKPAEIVIDGEEFDFDPEYVRTLKSSKPISTLFKDEE